MRRTLATHLVLVLAACSSSESTPNDAGASDASSVVDMTHDSGRVSTTLGTAERPARIVPPTMTPSGPAPLIVLLHGYTASAAAQDVYLGVSRAAGPRGAYVLLPNGTVDNDGNPFWNATPACCNFNGSDVDDVAYLRELVHEAIANFDIDPTRVYFMGHSNGGFMSYRMACEMSDEIAAIWVLAGSDYFNASDCVPTMPVSVLHYHGTDDDTILYDGVNGGFPSAEDTVARWATRAECDEELVSLGAAIDLIPAVAGAETEPLHFANCADGYDVQLNRMNGAGHIPIFDAEATGEIIDWLTSHHR